MDEPGFETDFTGPRHASLPAARIAIWGIGLMGGSLALGLRGKCRGLVGVDADPEVVALARESGVVDAAWLVEDPQLRDALADVDLLVLAAPARAILAALERLPALCSAPLVILDLGSTKRQIVAAMARLPERFDPLGGHPMCGKEKFSLRYAEAAIYQGAPFALTALERTTRQARALAEAVVRAAGARPLWITAEENDRWVAATSHAPYLLASALARVTPMEAAPLVGPGFRGASRLAGSSPNMMVDILATNADNIRAAMHRIREQLAAYDALLEQGDFDTLARMFEDGRQRYHEITGM